MMDYDFLHALLRSSMALFIILDPVGLLPVVMAVTVNQEPAERQRVLYLSALVAFGLTLLLTFTAKAVFSLYGMQIADFQIAGGVVLFLVALQTIHDRHMGEDVQQAAGIVPI
ncbi:MAG: MarC family protein, partial [Armatimonadetes bacterium]|nr:MarC family protein [Armatimonadota bacterium]